MRSALLYVLFLLSGLSGLVYQVVWVRAFGLAFGNTIHSAALVVAIFMLGLGVGSYVIGSWADRRYATAPDSLLRVYAWVEALIAALALIVSLVVPRLSGVVASMSAYTPGDDGWYVLTAWSYLARAGLAVLLLAPITVLMGGTLTVLIRYLVRSDVRVTGWTVALLYGLNTVGAAAGAYLTDFTLVPALGLYATQAAAAALNLVAAAGAWALSRRRAEGPEARHVARERARGHKVASGVAAEAAVRTSSPLVWMSLALALSGFAVLGLEILWFRHMGILLGGFRAVFSLMLTVMLLGLGAGALLGGWLERRHGRPGQWLMLVQGGFVAATLAGLALARGAGGDAERAATLAFGTLSPGARAWTEFWYNVRPMLLEVGLPSLLAGFAFPLANALVQRTESAVGGRAGRLYLANTAGAVAGSLATGYLLLPALGMQTAAAVLAGIAAAAMVPLYLVSRGGRVLAAAGLCAGVSLTAWLALPGDYLVNRALRILEAGERVVALSDGSTELIAVLDSEGRGRGLLTNGHAMSSTAPLDQRYMRALAHIPLLSMAAPERVLVIGFGVGNTTHAASLHPSVRRVDVADLSRHVLEHARYFRDANGDVLGDERVSVYVNDGRQHLEMMAEGTYDLITLEPPPVAQAGVGALYSREFYALARSRLTSGGYVSQWLPAYQVPAESSLAMVRAFLDVFPQAVLLSGMQAELVLLGTTAPSIAVDPVHLAEALSRAPAVRQDLSRLDMGRPREIVGSFVGSASTLARAVDGVEPATDNRPLQEYGVRSRLTTAVTGVPAALFDLNAVGDWCPRCFDGDAVAPAVEGLDTYLALLGEAYAASGRDLAARSRQGASPMPMDSDYLAAVVPDTAGVRAILGIEALRGGRRDEAVRAFEQALARDPGLESARRNLAQLRYEDGVTLMDAGRFREAEARLLDAVRFAPDMPEAHNDLGVVLASTGRLAEARDRFRQASALDAGFAEARENLAQAERSLGGAGNGSGK